ncbi:MAG TPA: CaiB/BaiF CoA-transferase family protein [Acidimicrobiales bacterium]
MDSPPDGALTGTTVLDLSTFGPAIRCSRVLADHGATVVKVGAPPRPGAEPALPAFHAYGGHRGMERVLVDLRSDAGRAAFLRLAAHADVVLESFRPGVVDRLGVGYEAVRAVHPGIVYCSTSGYGQDGPHARRAGHDLDYLAVGGYLHTSGRGPDGAPVLPGATVADIAAGGLHAATSILAALLRRERTGEGSHLDVAVTDGVVWMLSLYVDEHLATGELPGPGHDVLTGRYACYGVYGTADGRWLAVAAIEPAFWANLCRALGLERWIAHQHDDDRQDAIRADLAAVLATRDRDAWVDDLADADTCVAPVNDIAEVVADPQLAHRGAVVEAEQPGRDPFRQLGPVLAGTPRRPVHVLPEPGATHVDAVLGRAGFGSDEIACLRAEGVVA